ncbi:MAG TPA: PLDc N-terminal domain-containing protein [Planctomycetaceae bacterium]|nr:PLDc N-terminal domain-containing protein [Planctomycetaceae bacterium]
MLEAILFFGMFLLVAVVNIAGIALLVWAIIDAIKNPNLSDNQRIVWVLVILFVGCIGPVLYLLVGRNTVPPPGHTGGGPSP